MIRVRWVHRVGPWPSRTVALQEEKESSLSQSVPCTVRAEGGEWGAAREALPPEQSGWGRGRGLPGPRAGGNKLLCFKPPSLSPFVTVARAGQCAAPAEELPKYWGCQCLRDNRWPSRLTLLQKFQDSFAFVYATPSCLTSLGVFLSI